MAETDASHTPRVGDLGAQILYLARRILRAIKFKDLASAATSTPVDAVCVEKDIGNPYLVD